MSSGWNRWCGTVLMLLTLALTGCVTTGGKGDLKGDVKTTSDMTEAQRRASIRMQLAVGYYQQQQWATALDEIKQVIALDPGNAAAHTVRAMIYMEMGEMGPAESSFQTALKLSPDDPDLVNNYGWFLCQNGQEAKSIAYFEVAMKNRRYQSPAKAMNNAGVCSLKINNVRAAEEYFGQAFQYDPHSPVTNTNMAKLHYARGDYDNAHRFLQRVIKTDAMTADMLWTAIKVERKRGDRGAEAAYVAQLRRLYPTSAEFAAYRRGAFNE